MHSPVGCVVVLDTNKPQQWILFSNGVVLEKYNEVVNLSIVAAFTLPFGGDAYTETLLPDHLREPGT